MSFMSLNNILIIYNSEAAAAGDTHYFCSLLYVQVD